MSDAHFDLASFPAAETIKMLTKILVKITRTNDRLCSASDEDVSRRPHEQSAMYTCFHARSIPTIDIHSYLSRILKYTPCSNEVCTGFCLSQGFKRRGDCLLVATAL